MSAKEVTVFFHTSKLFEQGKRYEEIFRNLVEALVSDTARFVVVMSDKTADCGVVTKEKILSTAEGLFKINDEES